MRSLKPDLLFQQNLPFFLKNTWGQTACKILAMTSLIVVGSASTAIAQTASCVSPYNEVYGSNTPNQIWAIHGPTGAATQLTTNSSLTAINGMASDHNNFLVYYGDGTSIYAWDVLNGDHELITNNFQSFLTQAGYTGKFVTLSSGGAAFYNGSLYVGVDGNSTAAGDSSDQDFEIFRVNFQSGSNGRTIQSVTPLGIAAKSGGTITSSTTREDWGDFIISNTGVILATTNKRSSPTQRKFWNFDLNTNTFTLRATSSTNYQLAKSGDGRLWGLGSNSTVVELDSVGNLGSSMSTSIAASDAAECVTGQASVGDRVWNDVDSDGVQDAGELGISGVTIEIYRDLDKDGVIDLGEPLLATQTTDTNGNYNFTGLLPHDRATGTGRNDFIVKVNGGVPAGATATTATSKTADLSSATQVFDTADFGYKLLAVSGKVWDDADNSANNTFTNINTGTETGTNAGGLNAILVNASSNVIATTPVAADGTYTFSNITGTQSNVTIRLSTTAGTVGSSPPTASIPANWTNTSPLLTTAFNISTSSITGKDFGIEQLPDTNNVTAASQTNPGGTNTVQVPALSGTDPEDGTLGTGKTFKIVTLPTNGTLYYNGTAVTAGQNITSYDPTKLTIDPNDGGLTISFTYAAQDAASKLDPTPATVTMPFSATYSISGKVWDDADNSANNTFTNINTGTETGTNAGGLNAILVNASSNVIATTPVAADGTYTFSNITGTQSNVTIRLSTTAGTVGSSPPTASIPANWTNTSPLLTTAFNISTSSITGKDFGIEQLPDTNNVTAASQTNPGGTNTVQVPALSGTDPEDGTLGTGKTFKIVTLPTNGTLYYNGTAVTAGQNITSYDPTKLTIDPNDGGLTISFTYAAQDAASKLDPSPATVSMPFTAPPTYSISGTLYQDNDGNNTFNSEPTLPASITVKLLNASNSSVVATTTTTTSGTYTFTGVTAGNYKVQVDTSDTDIPTGMSLGTPNDVVANVSSSSISNINFGFAIPTNPISCDGNFYQIRVAGSGSQLFKINRSVNPYTQTQIGNITPDVSLNALGYNKLDGFMYAIKKDTNQLYRIDQNGAVFLGTVTDLPAADYNTATIDSAGNYYVKQGTLNSTIYKINVSTRTATTISLNQSINLGDMAFHPTDGAIYGLRDTTLYKIVITGTSGTVTTIGSTNISGSPAVGSVFFDASGSLYGYENAGTFYSINTTTGNATQVSTAPATTASDGASCAFTSPERVISTAKSVGTVSKVNNTTFDVPYTIVVTNTGTDTAPNTQITENLNLTFSTGSPTLTIPSSPTVTNGSCTANTGFNGKTDTKLLTGSNTLPIGASGTCTIKFTVRVVYPNQASVPSAAQNNTAYASSTSDSPNSGYTFASGTPIPPPALLASAQSTVSATYPATSNVANVLLVKRITAINGDRSKNPNDNTPLNLFVDDTTSTRKDDDNNPMWKPNYLVGAINAGKVKPGDEIEYTVYFVNADGANANSVRLCDRISANQDFKVNAYGTSKDVQLQLGTTPVLDLTSTNDASDRTQLVSAGGTVPSNCYLKAANNNGTLVIDVTGNTGSGVPNLTTLPGSTAQATPNDSYGFFRFITKVKP